MLRAQGAGVVPCAPRGSLKPQRKPVFELPWGHGCVCVRARAHFLALKPVYGHWPRVGHGLCLTPWLSRCPHRPS